MKKVELKRKLSSLRKQQDMGICMGKKPGLLWKLLHSKEQVANSAVCKGQGRPSLGIIRQQAAPWLTHLRTGVETGYPWLKIMVFEQSVTGDAHAFPPQPADSTAAGKPLQGYGQYSCDSVPRLSLSLWGEGSHLPCFISFICANEARLLV